VEPEIRRLVTVVDEIHREGGRPLTSPLRIALAAAVIHNPLAGRFVEDLGEFRDRFASPLGRLLAQRASEALGTGVEAYGKGALVGINGEIEHGSVIIHTLQFGNHVRGAASGKSLLPSAEKRGPAGSTLDIALKHTQDLAIRSHHQTYEFRIPDAPHPDEIVVVVALASGGRPHARSGSVEADLAASAVV
jgi:hypothetical protein